MPVAVALSSALARREVLEATRGEAEEDRQTGDRSEYENLALRHPSPFDRWL